MHASTLAVDIPNQRQRLVEKVNAAEALPADLRSQVLAQLEGMPDGDRICHGDYHPGNILVTGQGEVVIDWIDATLGNPLADVARTTVLLLGAIETDQIRDPWHKAAIRILHAIYLRRYFALCPHGKREYAQWIPVVAAARLSENISELEQWLVAQAAQGQRRAP
jgi:aminoglycoside phosphotransferase (APT) family kinase protein